MCDDDVSHSRRDFLKLMGLLAGSAALPLQGSLAQGQVENSQTKRVRIGYIQITDANPLLVAYKNKLFEKVSPKKTIEGFVGGFIFSIVAGIILAQFLMLQSYIHWVFIAVLASVFGTLGDLVESKFKREAGVKDSGNIMPGHGGILDRLDSVIFVIPFLYILYLIYFNYA